MEEFDPSRVTFALELKSDDDARSAIIRLISNDNKISIDDLSARIGISKSTVSREIRKMKNEGVINRVGGTKGHWKIV